MPTASPFQSYLLMNKHIRQIEQFEIYGYFRKIERPIDQKHQTYLA